MNRLFIVAMAVFAAIAVAPRAAHAACQNILVGASQANNGNSAINLATNPAKDADNALWIGKGAKNPTATISAASSVYCLQRLDALPDLVDLLPGRRAVHEVDRWSSGADRAARHLVA